MSSLINSHPLLIQSNFTKTYKNSSQAMFLNSDQSFSQSHLLQLINQC